jgi:AcrR family transcriptional regulator
MATRMTRAESKAATREELLAAARRVFLERGYHGASLELVAREAGYTKGAVYSAFSSKADLFLAVYDREADARRARAEAIRADPRVWLERLRSSRDWQIALLEFRLAAARDPQVNAAYAERHREFLAAMGDVAEDPRFAVIAAALANGVALEVLVLGEEAVEEQFVETVQVLTKEF